MVQRQRLLCRSPLRTFNIAIQIRFGRWLRIKLPNSLQGHLLFGDNLALALQQPETGLPEDPNHLPTFVHQLQHGHLARTCVHIIRSLETMQD